MQATRLERAGSHHRRMLQEAGGREQDEAVDVVLPAALAAHDHVQQQRRAAQAVAHRPKPVRVRERLLPLLQRVHCPPFRHGVPRPAPS